MFTAGDANCIHTCEGYVSAVRTLLRDSNINAVHACGNLLVDLNTALETQMFSCMLDSLQRSDKSIRLHVARAFAPMDAGL